MSKEIFSKLQQDLKGAGYYTGIVDGLWGNQSNLAWQAALADAKKSRSKPVDNLDIAWSAKVSPAFVARVKKMAVDLKMTYDGAASELMACMAFETGRTFSPTIKNGAGAPYYGLIQFGAAAAQDAGTTLDALLKMTAEQQLEYVYNFFKPYAGKLSTLSDVYMRILLPKAVGKPEDYVLFDKSNTASKAYVQNKGLDLNADGLITKAEAAAKVSAMLQEGMKPENRRPLAA